MNTANKPAILVIGHGSRDIEAVQQFKQVAAHLKQRCPDRKVSTGFLEFVHPVIAAGVEKLVQQDVTKITALPGMLMAAGHIKNDIPSELNTIMARYDHLKITYATDLGVQPKMIQAAAARIKAAETQFGEDYNRKDTLLVVVGRGTSDADANGNICKITRILEEGMGFAWAITCYSGVTSPLVNQALKTIHPVGFKKVIVFPYFLFTGRLIKRIYHWTDEYQYAHPEIQVVKASYLNDHPFVIDTFMDKLAEAEQGTANMNCQMCQYRVQILGSEHKVGLAQQGHHHHVRGLGTDVNHVHTHHH